MRLNRREFDLPAADAAFLQDLGRPWETVTDRGKRWLIVREWPVCDGYNHRHVSLAVDVQPGYPEAQLDMVYVHPSLQRSDGVAVNALSPQDIRGETWQRWSRHRTKHNPWRVGIDCLETHLALAESWFIRELARRN
mgnify:CR=1 FL=1